MPKQPEKPGDLNMQNMKYLRFVDPNDSTKIVQLSLVDTGTTATDGTRIYALGTTGGGGGSTIPNILVYGSYNIPDALLHALPAAALINGITIVADVGNSGTVWVGGNAVAANNGVPLAAGESIPIPINNLNKVYVIGALNYKVHFIGG